MPTTKVPLTKSRRTTGRHQGGVTFKGTPLNVSAAAAERYTKALNRAVTRMTSAAKRSVKAMYDTHAPELMSVAMDASVSSQARILLNAMSARFYAFFSKIAPDLAADMYRDVNRNSKANLHASLKELSGGLSLKTSVITGQIAQATKAGIAANVALIKSIPQQYFTDLQGEIFRSIQQGQGLKDVLGAVDKLGEVTHKRAGLIARDQTSKATTSLNVARMKALGVRKFEWLHSSKDKEPRPLHIGPLNHQIYSFDKPPVIDDRTGERGFPGQLINCRCRMIPVVDFGSEADD